MADDDIILYRGHDIRHFDREMLVTIIRELMEERKIYNSHAAIRARALGSVEMMRRGEKGLFDG